MLSPFAMWLIGNARGKVPEALLLQEALLLLISFLLYMEGIVNDDRRFSQIQIRTAFSIYRDLYNKFERYKCSHNNAKAMRYVLYVRYELSVVMRNIEIRHEETGHIH
jgi:hypothetical protein